MAKLKIWGRKTSANVQKVLWACEELGLEYERFDVGGPFGGNDKPEYRVMNPTGLVPTVEDGGQILWESNSITRYLGRKYGMGKIYPQDLAEAAKAERWMDWQLAHLGPAFSPVFWGLVRTPPEKRDPKAIAEAAKQTGKLWRVAESQLAKTKYLNGDNLSVADIPLGAFIYRWFALPIERPELLNLAAWYKRLCERPAFKAQIMIEIV